MKRKIAMMLIIGMVLVSFASAGLVSFLSNIATGTADVSSQLTLSISEPKDDSGDYNWHSGESSFDIGNYAAGETIKFALKVENNVNLSADTVLVASMDNDAKSSTIHCYDFSNIKITGTRIINGADETFEYYNGELDSSFCTDGMGLVINGSYLPYETEIYDIELESKVSLYPADYELNFIEYLA